MGFSDPLGKTLPAVTGILPPCLCGANTKHEELTRIASRFLQKFCLIHFSCLVMQFNISLLVHLLWKKKSVLEACRIISIGKKYTYKTGISFCEIGDTMNANSRVKPSQ